MGGEKVSDGGETGKSQEAMKLALKKALDSGTSGALAMTIQVSTLMWMRTTMNYQYRYGSTTSQALRILYKEGGIPRFYRGLGPALVQGPISRFGDTAANAGILALLQPYSNVPVAVKTGCASVAAGCWRVAIMPVDALKTTMQVEGAKGFSHLTTKVREQGPLTLYRGSLAAASATFVGHFPWFFTFNYLQANIPEISQPAEHRTLKKLSRNAFIGFCASLVSDTASNSLRVVKTTRQTFPHAISYVGVIRQVIEKDGVLGLFGRGLKTRLLANGLQGLLFSVLYKQFMEFREMRT